MGPRTRIGSILVVLAITAGIGGLGTSALPTSPEASIHPKLDGALAQLLSLDDVQRTAVAQRHAVPVENGRVRVVVEPAPGQSPWTLRRQVETLGGADVVTGDRLASASVPIDALASLAEAPDVAFVRRPVTAQSLEAETLARYTSATLPTGARLMHSYGVRGQGVRVAVIDQGFDQLQSYMDRGWIGRAAVADTVDLSGNGMSEGGVHGTDVARVVHEMAPEAELVLVNLGNRSDEVVLENAVDAALARGVDVVNHSVGWFGSNFGDGTGPVNQIVRNAERQGVLWINAAGNQARQHWIGAAVDRDGDGWLEFGLDREFLYVGSVPSGADGSFFFGGTFGLIRLTLVWDDFPTTGQDLDLHLLNGQDETVAVADAPQRGFDLPREELQHLVEQPGVFKLKVRASQLTRPVRFQIYSLESGHTLTPHVPYSSVIAPADCECALAVGAMNLRNWDRGRIEPFSARGPTTDGRLKPDLIAPDGMDGFSGTSAAAPAAAGAAALLLSQHPGWSVERLKSELVDNAQDLLAPGPDVDSGHGTLRLRPGRVEATRVLSDTHAHPGETVAVAITARMPGATFGELALEERLPAGFSLEAEGGPEPMASPDDGGRSTYRWSWPGLGPGAERAIHYRLEIPGDARPGEYELHGAINGRAIMGDRSIRVTQRRASLAQSLETLSWRTTSRAVTLQLAEPLPNGARWDARLFDLAGKRRAESGPSAMSRLTLALDRPLANGVYLVLATIRGADGGVHSNVRKVLVRR